MNVLQRTHLCPISSPLNGFINTPVRDSQPSSSSGKIKRTDLDTSIMNTSALPLLSENALLIGRLWQPNIGPILVAVTPDKVLDLSSLAPVSYTHLRAHETEL
jgi:hypothetical protein